MKRKRLIVIAVAVILAALFAPIPKGVYKDGGTREYAALTYKVVDWHRLTEDGIYEARRVYWFPENFRSVDELWWEESENVVRSFVATVLELDDTRGLVQPAEGESELLSSDRIEFSVAALEDVGAEVGCRVVVYYTGGIREVYPAQIDAIKWERLTDMQQEDYTADWIDPENATTISGVFAKDMVITEIYANCFFGQPMLGFGEETIKINGTLDGEWCVGDTVLVKFENYRTEGTRLEGDLLSVEESDMEFEKLFCAASATDD